MVVSDHAVSSVLIRENDGTRHPIYYFSRRLKDAETWYHVIEKLTYFLILTARKLICYFQAHTIKVLTSFPLKQVFSKPETSGRLIKWGIELSQYEIEFHPRAAIKGQALADFVNECTNFISERSIKENDSKTKWQIFINGASNEQGQDTL